MPNKTISLVEERAKGKHRRLKISTGITSSSNKVKNQETKWPGFVERLKTTVRTNERLAEYLKLPLPAQNKIKDVGYFVPGHFENGVRKKANLYSRDCVTLDIDHAPPDYALDIELTYGEFTYALYSTHKHQPDVPRLRLVFPLTRSVDEVEYLAVSRRIASWLNMDWYDDTTYQFTRVMYWPSTARDGEYVFLENESERWINPDDVLAEYEDWRDASTWPVSSRHNQVLRISAAKAGDPTEKPGIVGAFCRAYSVSLAMSEFIPEAYVEGTAEDRLTYSGGSSANGAVIYDNDLFLYSHHEHDPCSLRLVNAWDMVRLHRFSALDDGHELENTPVNKLPSHTAMVALASHDTCVKAELMAERLKLAEDFDDIGHAIPSASDSEIDDILGDTASGEAPGEENDENWTRRLRVTDKGAPVACLMNLELFMENDPKLKGCVAFNDFSGEILQMTKLPDMRLTPPVGGALWSDLAELKIKAYVERRYDLTFTTVAIHEAAMTLGDRHSFNPITDYLDWLEWDGKPRLDKFLVRFFGAEDSAYTRAVTRKWFCAGVARAYRPGTKFDHMLVLEGVEGLRKSGFFEVLSQNHFTDDMSFGFESREVVERTAGSWIVEVPEMVTRSNAETEHVKAFLSRRRERCRAAFARNAGSYPRKFILAGSTNESAYLKSTTGNRRFWPVRGDGRKIDLAKVAAVVDQLWAEAKHRWYEGEPLYLDEEQEAQAKEQQAQRVVKDDTHASLEQWLNKPIRANHWDVEPGAGNEFDDTDEEMMDRDRVSVLEIWCEFFGGDLKSLNRKESMRINDMMRTMPGWEEHATVRFNVRYGRARGFVRVLAL